MTNKSDPKQFNEPDRSTLDNTDVGSLGQALMTLTKELWVLRDRVSVLEAVLAEKGIDVTDDIERFQPDDEMQTQLDAQGKALVVGILDALNGR